MNLLFILISLQGYCSGKEFDWTRSDHETEELLMLKEVGPQVGGHSGRRTRKGDSTQIQQPFQVHAGALSPLSLVALAAVGNARFDGQWGSAHFLFPLTHSSLSHIEKGLI